MTTTDLANLDQASAVSDVRRRASERFEALGYPTRRDEAWRYTSLRPITETPFEPATTFDLADDRAIRPHLLHETHAHQLVFVNGRFDADRSTIGDLPDGVRVGSLAAALADDPAAIEGELASAAPFEDEAFTAFNTAFIDDGAVVIVPAGRSLERPVNIVFVSAPTEGPVVVHPRVLVVLGTNASATVLETYATGDPGLTFTNAVTELVAGDNARIDHYRIQAEREDACHVSTVGTRQGRDANVTSHCFTTGGALTRNNIEADLTGENGEAVFNGLSLTHGEQHVDSHLRINHLVPNCRSWEFYKGILDDRSHAVFTGRIYVKQDAQKTDAKQTNMNLLLSDDAGVTTKPQLEIFADDVKCTHGATIGQLEDSHLFYLQARGIDRDSARTLLVYAFANETIAEVKIDEVRRRLVGVLRARLPQGEIVQEDPDDHKPGRIHPRDL